MNHNRSSIDALNLVAMFVTVNMSEIQKRRYEIVYKDDGSPVTEADVWLEKQIFSILSGAIPSIELIGEESYKVGMRSGNTVAIVDPIDGTENFCSGLKEWGISIGIWTDGVHDASLLMLPELGLQLMTGDAITRLRSRITGFSSSYCDAISDGIRDATEYRVTGCAVYNIFNVIHGSFARFVNPKGARVWDLLPGLALALEHGCEVILDDQPYDGRLLDPTRKYRVDIRH